jgi:metal-responsive CopG/Arc/MetJ family transcriptional regulator
MVGRKKRWHEIMGAPFPKGTFARMDAVLKKDGKEDRTDLVREAVERELERREKAQQRKPGRRS